VKELILPPPLPVLVILILAACGSGNDDDAAAGPSSDGRSGAVVHTQARDEEASRLDREAAPPRTRRPEPSIGILKPTTGQTVHGDAVTVSVSIKGFKLVNQRVRPPFPRAAPGKGHVHFYLDTKTLPRTHSPPTTGTYRSVSSTTYTWTGIPPGRHTLAVQLVGKDHAPLGEPVKDRVTVTTVG
jgi:hypothetical protein